MCAKTIKKTLKDGSWCIFFCTFVLRMKVLIVNTSERGGGAAIAASRLTEALINNGVKAKMMVMHKQSDALYVVPVGDTLLNKWHFLYERVVIWLNNLFSRKDLFKVSIANTGIDITQTPEFQEADVIHLHWINQGFLSRKSIHRILVSGKPVVWTMHDMWEATSICHHAYSCDRFQTACSHCQFLKLAGKHDLASRVFLRKQKMYEGASRLCFAAVGDWLADRARSSALIGNYPIVTIPNSISLSHFVYVDRNDARMTLDVKEQYVIAFGAARIDEPIKGFDYLVQALQYLVSQDRFRSDDVRLLLFGDIRDASKLQLLPVRYTHLGYVADEHRLSLIYSASNATVSSSLYETFGQTLIEAQACGSLPVAFNGSGPNDIIAHRQNGYLADYKSAESLADGIEWALKTDMEPRELRRNVMRHFAESVVANKYIDLYSKCFGPQLSRNINS